MHMRPGAAAGISHQSNRLPALYFFAAFLQKFLAVPVAGNQPVTVINDDGFPQQPLGTDKGDDSIGGRQNRCAAAGGDIKPLMKFALTGKW